MERTYFKSIIFNFIKNLMAYALPVVVLQFVIQPVIASKLGEENNGLILTIIALNYFITSITASILLQIRLLQNEKYEKEILVGDYNLILLAMAIFNSFVMAVGTWFYMGAAVTVWDIVLCIVIALLFLIHDYIGVQYRSEFNYTKILISNIVLCFGYLLGILCFLYVLNSWQIVFIVAYGVCEIYDLSHTTYWREPFKITPLMPDTIRRFFLLAGASILGYLVSYGDRLLLFPVADGSTVSILTASEVMGKMLMLISSPLSSFLLAYLVKESSVKYNPKLKHILLAFTFLGVCYVVAVGVSIPMLKLLYPQWAVRSAKYVPLTTLTSLLNLISAVLNVIIIRFCKTKWQLIVNGSYLAMYLISSFTLFHFFGLMGFCIGNMIAATFKLIIIALIGTKNIKIGERDLNDSLL